MRLRVLRVLLVYLYENDKYIKVTPVAAEQRESAGVHVQVAQPRIRLVRLDAVIPYFHADIQLRGRHTPGWPKIQAPAIRKPLVLGIQGVEEAAEEENVLSCVVLSLFGHELARVMQHSGAGGVSGHPTRPGPHATAGVQGEQRACAFNGCCGGSNRGWLIGYLPSMGDMRQMVCWGGVSYFDNSQ